MTQTSTSKGPALSPEALRLSTQPTDATTPKPPPEIQLSEDYYRSLFDALDDGFCVIEKIEDAEGGLLDFRYVEVNPAFVLQSGVKDAADVVGKTIRQLFPGISEDWDATYEAVLKTGEPIRFERELVPRERWLELHAFPVVSSKYRRLAIIFKDITKRALAEQTLRETEAFNRSIIASSPDCIKILDLEGTLLSIISGQKLLNIEDVQPLLNKSWLNFWGKEDQLAVKAAINAALEGGKGSFVGFFRTPSGEPKWWDVAISPILDVDGKPTRLLAVSREVTQRRFEEINLKFLASISRDLVTWNTAEEMMRAVAEKLASHLQLSVCALAEINETGQGADEHRGRPPSRRHAAADCSDARFVAADGPTPFDAFFDADRGQSTQSVPGASRC